MKTLRGCLHDHVSSFLADWSLPRQMAGQSVMAEAAQSRSSRALRPRQTCAELDRRQLALINSVLSVVMGGEFPLRAVPLARNQMGTEVLNGMINVEETLPRQVDEGSPSGIAQAEVPNQGRLM